MLSMPRNTVQGIRQMTVRTLSIKNPQLISSKQRALKLGCNSVVECMSSVPITKKRGGGEEEEEEEKGICIIQPQGNEFCHKLVNLEQDWAWDENHSLGPYLDSIPIKTWAELPNPYPATWAVESEKMISVVLNLVTIYYIALENQFFWVLVQRNAPEKMRQK